MSRSYCPDHCPAQTLSVSSELSLPQSCSICLDAIEPVLGYALLKCPCCHGSWFHRDCVQVHKQRNTTVTNPDFSSPNAPLMIPRTKSGIHSIAGLTVQGHLGAFHDFRWFFL